MNYTSSAVNLLLNSAHGHFIPHLFVTDAHGNFDEFFCKMWGLVEENKTFWEPLLDTECHGYDDAWCWVLDNAVCTEGENTYRLFHGENGDLFSYCFEKMTEAEKQFLFGYYYETDDCSH